jgi:hypothetical protein
VLGHLCHGRARRPGEPYGAAAPLARAIAWGLVCLGLLSLAAGLLVAGVAGRRDGRLLLARAAGVALTLGGALRVAAAMCRPSPLSLPAWDTEGPP